MFSDYWFDNVFKDYSSDIAVIYQSIAYKYSDLIQRVDFFTDYLNRNKVQNGDVVVIKSDYSFDAIALFFSLYKNKNVIVPIISNVEKEIEQRINAIKVNFVIELSPHISIRNIQNNENKHTFIKKLYDNNHAGLVLFSSGSTGEPKAMLHNLDILGNTYSHKKQKKLNTLIFLTFDHIGGIDTMFSQFSIAGTLTIPSKREPVEVCKLIEKYKIDVFPTSPTFLNLFMLSQLYEKYDLSSLKIIAFGAEPMPKSLLHKLKSIFSDVQLQQKFGTSETNAIRIKNKNEDDLFMKIDDPNIEYKVVKDELWLKSKTQVIGYLNSSMDNFTDDGWFKTGDLVETREDGYIKILGREKELINVGGEKVLPHEVESIILDIDEIKDVMVYGIQNNITGQTVVCDVVLSNSELLTRAKTLIRKHCKDKLNSYKIPTKVNVVDKTNFGDRFKKIRRK